MKCSFEFEYAGLIECGLIHPKGLVFRPICDKENCPLWQIYLSLRPKVTKEEPK